MLLKQILLILRARYLVIGLTTVLLGVLAYLVSSNMDKRYAATAQILIDIKEPDALNDRAQSGALLTASYMGTQNDIIRSDRVVRKVVQKLGLTTNPQAIEQWQRSGSESPIEQYYAEILRGYLEVVPTRNSNVIGLRFTNPSPRFAADAANTFARTYIETTVELRADPTRDFAAWFTEQTAREREQLELAQQRLSQFQRQHGFVQTDEKADVNAYRLNELNAQLTSVQGLHAESSSRANEAQSRIDTSPDVLQSSVVASLRAEVAHSEAKLDELHRHFGANHPQVQSAEAELASLRNKLDAEMDRIARSIKTANSINAQREEKANAALAEQRRSMLAQRESRDQLAVLQRDVETAQRTYDVVTQRLAQTKLESQINQTNLILLSEALTPTIPSWPRVGIITIVGFGLGLLTGMLLALGLELRRPRLRTPEEVFDVLQLRVLATLPKVPRVRGLIAGPVA